MRIFFQEIADLYQEKGDLQYHGENVTQLVHAWQCGQLAKQQEASPELQMAAWLHDIGHLLTGQTGTPTVVGIDDQHQVLGSHYLAQKLPPAVVQPVALHVLAKRYLVSTNRDYQAQLSEDSIRSLALQGGSMTEVECQAFIKMPFAQDAISLRQWDDAGKATRHPMPTQAKMLADFKQLAESLM